jgi:hypothetical protein
VAARTIDQFVEGTMEAFGRALDARPAPDDATLLLADRPLDLRFAAPELGERFRPALVSREVDDGPAPDFTLGCWDRVATGIAPPPPPWSNDDFLPRGRIRGLTEGTVRATYEMWSRILYLYDRDRRVAIMHAADASMVPRWVDRAPFRTLLTWWAADTGLALLHASSVATDAGAVAIAGASGSGKSTTALACLAAGMQIIGDDACLVDPDPTPRAFSVYGRAKLEPDAAEKLPQLAALAVDRHAEQVLLDPGDLLAASAPLRAILVPHVTGERETRVVPLPPADALHVLVPSSMLEGGGIGGGTLQTMGRLVRALPCFRLELGHDLDGVVATVRATLEGAA